jgi:cytochrome P450 family 135
MAALPPGPRLPRAVQTALLWRRTQPFLEACHRRYGDVFTIRSAVLGTLVYVADREAIKGVFTGDPTTFHAGEANAILGPVLGRRSLLLLDEGEHLRRRKQMLPPFHGEAIRRYEQVVAEIAGAEAEAWPARRPLALQPRMQSIALEIILRAVIGVSDSARLGELRRLLPRVTDLRPTITLMWVWPRLRRYGPWRRYERLMAQADAVLLDEVARRRAAPGEDVLSLLAAAGDMTDSDLRDQVLTLLVAGHETTATGLAWAFERLVRHPGALARATATARDGEDDGYLDAVVRETLRVRPVIFDVARHLTRPVEIAGHELPAGVAVMPAIGLVQRGRAFGPDPLAFRPERFLEGDPPPSYAWIPFGGGARRCLGAAFAQLEMRVVLREVLRRVDLQAADRRPEKVRVKHITMVPAKGARVVVTGRVPGRRLEPAALRGV